MIGVSESIIVVAVVLVGAALGYLLGQGYSRGAPSRSARIHKTIPFDRSHRTSDAELDAQMEDGGTAITDAISSGSSTTTGGRSRSESSDSQSSRSSSDGSGTGDLAAEDADDDDMDLQTTLEHMKLEHAQHLEQFKDANNAAANISPDPASPPLPQDAHRRIFIVAHRLPLSITNVTGRPTPSATPQGSPLVTPSAASASAAAASLDLEEEFSLGEAASTAAASSTQPNTFDQHKRPSLSQMNSLTLPGGRSLPGSSVKVVDGTKFRVEWDDSRSFLSNLRCLLTPTPPTQPVGSSPSTLPPGLSPIPPADIPEVTWVGQSNIPSLDGFTSQSEKLAYEATLKENFCLPVYLDSETQEGFQAFCKSILWPLLHYMMPTNTNQTVGLRWAEYWTAYMKANQAYADVICTQMKQSTSQGKQEEAIVWIHNMQLFGLPSMIRQQLPRATIGLFIHTPFPSSDVFRSLPSRKEILESIMAADLLGFHTFDYARHFLSCIKRVMDLDFETLPGGLLGVRYNGRFVSILISHVGIQSSVFAEAADSEILKRRVEKLRAQYPGKKLIASLDDIDLAKAPMLKLQAFDRFLSRFPEWKDKIAILQMFIPSKSSDSALGKKLQGDLDAFILELKRKYGDAIISIIPPFKERSHTDQNGNVIVEQDGGGLRLMELVRLYNAADVALISGNFDGLNLIPFEATASQGSSVPCALIISEFMGCSRSLNGVLRVNPWSLEAISEALNTALSMSNDERRANHSRRYHYVMTHTVERWATGFLAQLSKATKLGAQLNYVQVGHHQGGGSSKKLMGLKSDFIHLPTQLLVNTYSAASLRVIFLDYDGTLVQADKIPSDASCGAGPPTVVHKLLKFLSEDPNTVVFLMSGRTRTVLSEWFADLPNLGLAAEKGLFLRWPARIASQCRFDLQRDQEDATAERFLVRGGGNSGRNGSGSASLPDSSSSSSSDSSSESDDDDSGLDSDGSDGSPASHVHVEDWECLVPLEDISWKATASEIIRAYTEQTDGSYVEDKEFAIVWHYERADVEYGRMQAADLQKYLVKILANPNVDVLRYDRSRILEVKPHGVNKGLAATAILESLWLMHENANKSSSPHGSSAPNLPRASSEANRGTPASRFGLQVAPPSNGTVILATGPDNNPLSPRSSATSFHPFVLAIGDDRADEEMFVAVQQKAYLDGRVRGRQSLPMTEAFPRSIVSVVPTSIPQTPSHSIHDPESPMSPSTGQLRALKAQLSPPSTDPNLFTVCVGLKPSNAHFFVNNPDETLRSLYGLVLRDQEEKGGLTTSTMKQENKTPITAGRQLGLSKRVTSIQNEGTGLGNKKGSFGLLSNFFAGKKE